MEGQWSLDMTTWSEEGQASWAPGLRSRKEVIADGRYLREQIEGPVSGGRHEKLTLLGYNLTRSRFEYFTADNYDGVMLLYVSAPGVEASSREVELLAEYAQPDNAGQGPARFVTIRTVLSVESADRHVVRNFYRPGGRPERPFLEYVYTRQAHEAG